MSDFFQNGVIATFHRLGELNLKKLENDLKDFSQIRPIALVFFIENLKAELFPIS